MHELFRIESISKEYGEVQNSVKALDNVSLTIKRRDIQSRRFITFDYVNDFRDERYISSEMFSETPPVSLQPWHDD